MTRLPNFLYIGTSKAGSTWIYKMLNEHPEIHTAPGKGLYFFCGHYDRGWDWYRQQFALAHQHRVIGEISHTYMASEAACRRIAEHLPEVKLLACVREPVERTFSDYLDGVKNGAFEGTFEETLERVPALIDIGRYGMQLQWYLDRFPRQQVHVALFDELASQPAAFAQKIHSFLGVARYEIAPSLRQNKLMPAGAPRSKLMAYLAKRASKTAKRLGLKKMVGRAKTSTEIRNLLYRQYTGATRPKMRPETRQRLHEIFAPEVRQMDHLLGTNFGQVWQYSEADAVCSA